MQSELVIRCYEMPDESVSENRCMQVAEAALGEHAGGRYQRIEAAWLTLAEQQQWLDGERLPIDALEKVTGK